VRVIAAGCQLLWTEMCSCFNAAFVRMLNHGVRLPGGRDRHWRACADPRRAPWASVGRFLSRLARLRYQRDGPLISRTAGRTSARYTELTMMPM
jgi:hypothetical protein